MNSNQSLKIKFEQKQNLLPADTFNFPNQMCNRAWQRRHCANRAHTYAYALTGARRYEVVLMHVYLERSEYQNNIYYNYI